MIRFHEPFYTLYDGALEASERFAELARDEMRPTFDEVNLLNLQCYLILSLVEMGSGNEHRAWVQLGIAIRMVHVLRLSSETFERKDWIDAEIKRRTFWCCFILDRLMSNGSDRPPSFDSKFITTLLPIQDSDLILGKEVQAGTLNQPGNQESLLAYTIIIVDIVGCIVVWSGRGGREVDGRLPWDPDMPFCQFEKSLNVWEATLPRYMQLHPGTLDSHIAAGQGNLFAIMHLVYYHARCYLSREYFPFLSPPGWDPANGPCDGPLYESGFEPSAFWLKSAHDGVTNARRISKFFNEIVERDLAPWAYPFSGMSEL